MYVRIILCVYHEYAIIFMYVKYGQHLADDGSVNLNVWCDGEQSWEQVSYVCSKRELHAC